MEARCDEMRINKLDYQIYYKTGRYIYLVCVCVWFFFKKYYCWLTWLVTDNGRPVFSGNDCLFKFLSLFALNNASAWLSCTSCAAACGVALAVFTAPIFKAGRPLAFNLLFGEVTDEEEEDEDDDEEDEEESAVDAEESAASRALTLASKSD